MDKFIIVESHGRFYPKEYITYRWFKLLDRYEFMYETRKDGYKYNLQSDTLEEATKLIDNYDPTVPTDITHKYNGNNKS